MGFTIFVEPGFGVNFVLVESIATAVRLTTEVVDVNWAKKRGIEFVEQHYSGIKTEEPIL